MQCPFCGQDKDKVVDSRSSEGGRSVRRRRQCLLCERRFTTYERPEGSIRLTVIKNDHAREPYDRAKIIAGLERACYKRKITEQDMLQIVEAVEEEIYRQFDKDVPSRVIGDLVGQQLRPRDAVAYVRFASVYRDFKDVGELIDEATEIQDTPPIGPEQRSLFEGDVADTEHP